MNIRVHFVIDPDGANSCLHLQSVKGGAQRTGACPKRRMPKTAPSQWLVLLLHTHVKLPKGVVVPKGPVDHCNQQRIVQSPDSLHD